jgi:hypothetical protein
MIINVHSVILLFIDGVSFALAVLLVGVTIGQLRSPRDRFQADAVERSEGKVTLLLLVALVLAALRALSWPLLYATLQSFVPSIEGAMCAYGVTRMLPRLGVGVQAAKPVVFFLAGGWLLLNRVDLETKTSPLARTKTIAMLAVAAFALVEIPLETALITGTRATFVVTCCTTVADVADRPTALVPSEILGGSYGRVLTGAFFGVGAVLVGLAAAGSLPRRRGRPGAGLLAAGALLAAIAVPLAWIAAAEVLAPAWMGLPYHHCLYCFIVYRDAPLAVGAFLLGIFCFWWAGILHLLARGEEAEVPAGGMIRRCRLWALFLLSSALGMALIHLVLRGRT